MENAESSVTTAEPIDITESFQYTTPEPEIIACDLYAIYGYQFVTESTNNEKQPSQQLETQIERPEDLVQPEPEIAIRNTPGPNIAVAEPVVSEVRGPFETVVEPKSEAKPSKEFVLEHVREEDQKVQLTSETQIERPEVLVQPEPEIAICYMPGPDIAVAEPVVSEVRGPFETVVEPKTEAKPSTSEPVAVSAADVDPKTAACDRFEVTVQIEEPIKIVPQRILPETTGDGNAKAE